MSLSFFDVQPLLILTNVRVSNSFAGAVCWSIQLLPQIYKSYKRKDTAGLSSWMLGIWVCASLSLSSFCGAFADEQEN